MQKRIKWVIAAMAVVIVVLIAILAFKWGRSSAPGQPVTLPGPKSEPVATRVTPTEQPVPEPEPDEQAELRRWIVGGWAEVSTGCETDTGEHFNADGRYGNYSQQGYWSVANGRLTTRVTHELREIEEEPYEDWVPRARPSVTSVRLIRESADRGTIVREGERVRLMRCPLSNYEATIPVRR